MILLRVVSVSGRAPSSPLEARLDETGGTIGRDAANDLPLADPEKTISREHARVVFRAGRYMIIDNGRAIPVVLNGKPLGTGREQAIGDGDEIQIGNYVIRVAVQAAEAASPSSAVPGAFGGLIPPPAASPPVAAPGQPFERIPTLFDPFGRQAPAPAPSGSLIPDDVDLGLSGDSKLDDMIRGIPAGSDPFPPGHVLGDPALPMHDFTPQRDDTPELHGHYQPPPARPIRPAPPAGPSVMRSWDAPTNPGAAGDAIKSIIIPATGGPLPVEEPAPPPRAPAPPAVPPAASAAPVGADALVREFLAGAGVSGQGAAAQINPAMMKIFGEMLREALEGTLHLLAARAHAKRELRAQMTVIVGADNNPLKHSPNVDAALALLLAPPIRGFMTPVRAMREAYDDLRAHQYAFSEGLRAALNGLLTRFDPVALERRLTDKSFLDSISSRSRKSKLWDQYEALYAQISREAEDDFHKLFGDEFVRAYEENLAKLESAKPVGRE